MFRTLIAALLCTTLARPVAAATLSGATFPDTYQADGQTLVLNGLGLRTVTVFNVRAYVAALYLPHHSSDARQILAMPGTKIVMMQMLHAASKSDVEKQFREAEQKNCGAGQCDKADQPDFERLIAATPALKVGDTFSYVFTAGSVRALVNNEVIGDFANPDLAMHLLNGFIGPYPPSAEVRAGLLGQH